jgi:peptidoglycan/xylan/chitin deacetylase (PgdA/CDA1 family)
MNKAFISLTFDDGLRSQFERGVPILNRYGLPGTFFLVANTDAIFTDGWAEFNGLEWHKIDWSRDDIDLLKKMIARGHEIGAHTMTHKRGLIAANPVFEATECKRLIEGWLGVEIPSFCYPFYVTNEVLKEPAIKAGYKQARGGKQNSYYAPQSSIDLFDVDCRQIEQTGEDVSAWLRPGCWHVVTFHGVGGEQDGWVPVTEAEFERQISELARLRDAGCVEVVTFRDGAERFRSKQS